MNEEMSMTGNAEEAADVLADLSLQLLQLGLLSGKQVTVSCSVNDEVVSATEGYIKSLDDAYKFADNLFTNVRDIPDKFIDDSPSMTIRGLLGDDEVFSLSVSRLKQVTH